ncbi:ABC transporter permease [Bremerella sp. T1]|uniref:ABC transporter permease n=1 Tax=Bremerella sp. TYQ1 TaxID=3119568 RepID=UPI001CCEFABC|nr:FtsX-like permease family protein [Bremerella volcania]UBM36353.1 ABC transporter permease [Bremerella volcania]
MNLRSLIWQELKSRPTTVAFNSLTILLGVAALVAIRHVTVYSEEAVANQLTNLGANILVLPKEATLQDYYAADQNGGTLPEEYVAEVFLSGLSGIEQVSPRLNVTTELHGHSVAITGILPQSEVETLATWQATTSFMNPTDSGCCLKANVATTDDLKSPEALVKYRAIQNLDTHAIILGADIAKKLNCNVDDRLKLIDETFTVIGVLPATGTVDDGRIFAHLHSIQRIWKKDSTCNAIEIVGCCEDAAGGLVPQLRELLPDAKVVTILQVVETQVGVNQLMAKTSWIVLAVLVIVGGVGLAGVIAANVRERRREIGTLMALGATPSYIQKLFLGKALILGLGAGTLGCLIGVVAAVIAGPVWAGVSISPLLGTSMLSVLIATFVAVIAAWWPAQKAAHLDPCICFREV